MASVSINPPKTPVTKGSMSIAKATLPNVCKMPGPPAPFVPTPLPNIGKSSDSPQGYSTSVKIEGNAVAIKGATFNSMGDIASKGTGGGMVSMNTHGPTKFIGLGSMDVKIEGKNVQLLGDPMLNNCGPSGSPANSATMGGVKHSSGAKGKGDKDKCKKLKAKYNIETASHKANTSGKTKKTSRSYQSHHVIQDDAIAAIVARSDALAIMLANSHKGTEHGRITARQNERKHNKARGGEVPATTYGGLKKQAHADLVAGLEGKRKDKNGKPMSKKDAKAVADCIVAEADKTAKAEAKAKKKALNDSTPVKQPGGCFAAGTLVTLASGALWPVEQLSRGDRLRTSEGCAELIRIDECRHSLVELLVGESLLTLATYHRLVDADGVPVRVDALRVGDLVATATGFSVVKSVRALSESRTIYRLGLSHSAQCLLGQDAVLALVQYAGPRQREALIVRDFLPGDF